MDDFNLMVFSILVLILILTKRFDLGSNWANLTRLVTILISSFFIAIMCVYKFGYMEGAFPFLTWFVCGVISIMNVIRFVKEKIN